MSDKTSKQQSSNDDHGMMAGGKTIMEGTSKASYGSTTHGNTKYGGMLKTPIYKTILLDLYQLFSYIQLTAPNFSLLNDIVSIIRIFQLIGPCLNINNIYLWNHKSLAGKTINYVSIPFQIIPSFYYDASRVIFTAVFAAVSLFFIFIVLCCSMYFKHNANLPKYVIVFLGIYFDFYVHIFQCPIAGIIFEVFSQFSFTEKRPSSTSYLLSFLCLISILIQSFFAVKMSNQTLVLKKQSLLTISTRVWNIMFTLPIVMTVISAFSARINIKLCYIILIVINIFLYILVGFLPFYKGGFIIHFQQLMIITSGIFSILVCVTMLVFYIMNREIPIIMIFVFFFAFVVLFLIVSIGYKKLENSRLLILDEINDNEDSFYDRIKSKNQALNILPTGFEYGHPCCFEKMLTKMMIERWTDHPDVWFAFAKYMAIFPEETRDLEMIIVNIHNNKKLRGSEINIIKQQCRSIIRMRETNLSVLLKTKLNKISRIDNQARHKLRHVWDIVLQGNMGEIEIASKRAIAAIKKTDIEFTRLLQEYPNNRFVTRSYSRFLHELKADHIESAEYITKTRSLQRGLTIAEDHCHEYGVKIFPKIPPSLNKNRYIYQDMITSDLTSESKIFDSEMDFNDTFNAMDGNKIIVEKINKLEIPAIKYTSLIRLLVSLIFFVIPMIVILIVVSVLMNDLQEPVLYIKQITTIRNRLAQIAAFSIRRIGLLKGLLSQIPQFLDREAPDSLGGSFNITEQILAMFSITTESIQKLNTYQDLKSDDEYISEVYKRIFTSSINYIYYENLNNATNISLSVHEVAVDYVVQGINLLNTPISEINMTDNGNILNIAKNTQSMLITVKSTISIFTDYYQDINKTYSYYANILKIVLIVLSLLAYLISTIVEITWLNENKKSVYSCLMGLPKNLISQLSESLRIIKKDAASGQNSSFENNTEINKQEENILKIFNSGGYTSSTKYDDIIIFIISSLLLCILYIVSIIEVSSIINQTTKLMLENVPHINNAGGTYSALQAAMLFNDLLNLYGTQEGKILVMTDKDYSKHVKDFTKLSNTYYKELYFGSENTVPFYGFPKAIENAKKKTNCKNKYGLSHNLMEIVDCYDADLIYTLISTYITDLTMPYFIEGTISDPKNEKVNLLWSIVIYVLYDDFFKPMLDDAPGTVKNNMDLIYTQLVTLLIPMCIIAIIIETVNRMWTNHIESHIRDVLRFLLHTHADAIFQSNTIMKVLSGNFSNTKSDMSSRGDVFYDKVLENLLDGIIYAELKGLYILGINQQCRRIFGIEKSNDLIKKDLESIMKSIFSNKDNEIESLLMLNMHNNGSIDANSVNINDLNCTSIVRNLTYRTDEEIYFQATSQVNNNKLIISIRDITATIRYQNLIKEEKNKSDVLLKTILPSSLVQRVKNGEKNISFSVQSVSIVFMDIVSFTPWCGSLPADKVMKTLNLLFKKFDSLVLNNKTMMKVKCIGDCYMAAGGVFSDLNQPTEHAKEAVGFGLDSIEAVNQANQELNENLQIRVGINSGGPIVAGVLGVGKPTFEIIGPAINMAQQMEHHGVPMKVHISRNVYELVYGNCFDIKERGTTAIKNANVETYLVAGYIAK